MEESHKRYQWYQINFERPFTVEQARRLLEALALDVATGSIVFEARVRGGKVNYLVRLQSHEGKQFKRYFEANMPPNSTLSELLPNDNMRRKTMKAVQLSCTKSTLNLTPERIETIALSILTAMREAQDEGEEVVVQAAIGNRYLPAPVPDQINDPDRNTLLDKLLGTTKPLPSSSIVSLKARFAVAGFSCAIRIGAMADVCNSEERSEDILRAAIGGVKTASIMGTRLSFKPIPNDDITYSVLPRRKKDLRLCPNEIAGLLVWPYNNMRSPALQSPHPRTLAPVISFSDTVRRRFGRATAKGHGRVPLGISIEDAMKHTYILGPTGSGKSTTIEWLALEDIRAGRGVVIIEPKTDSGKNIMQRVPKERLKDVVFVDPLSDYPVGINPFSAIKNGADPYVVAEGIYTVFKNLSKDSWGKRMGDILMSALLTLAKTKDANILMLLPMLTDAKYRKPIVEAATKEDPIGLGQFWDWFEGMSPRERNDAISPIMRRLREFTLKPSLCAMLGQSNPRVDLNDVFTNKHKIFIISLNKGKIGEETAKLLGSLVVSQLWSLTLARASTSMEDRYPVNIYIDEVQSYLNLPLDLAEALSQARSYGVGFALAHQYRSQLPPTLRNAIDGNVQNLIIFGLHDSNDCQAISKLSGGILEAEDLLYREPYQIYLRTLHEGKPVWVSGETFPPSIPITYNWREVKELSEKLYGIAREQIIRENLENGNIEKNVTETMNAGDHAVVELNNETEGEDV